MIEKVRRKQNKRLIKQTDQKKKMKKPNNRKKKKTNQKTRRTRNQLIYLTIAPWCNWLVFRECVGELEKCKLIVVILLPIWRAQRVVMSLVAKKRCLCGKKRGMHFHQVFLASDLSSFWVSYIFFQRRRGVQVRHRHPHQTLVSL